VISSYIIRLEPVDRFQLKSLKEEILEQLGKKVVSFDLKFDVGYTIGAQRISFSEADGVAELQWITTKGYSLWCDGVDTMARKQWSSVVHVIDDEEEEANEVPEKRASKHKPKVSVLEERKSKILQVAKDLKEKHGDDYNMVQVWAETLVNEQYKSCDNPPHGLIWGGQVGKPKYTRSDSGKDTQSMMRFVGDMAMSIATAIKSPDVRKEIFVDSANTPTIFIILYQCRDITRSQN